MLAQIPARGKQQESEKNALININGLFKYCERHKTRLRKAFVELPRPGRGDERLPRLPSSLTSARFFKNGIGCVLWRN